MQKLTIFSNLKNDDALYEDTQLKDLLNTYFDIKILDMFDDVIFEQSSLFLIRNVWGRQNGRERMLEIYKYLEDSGISYSADFHGKGDQQGKRYLIDLYNSNYQVIPTFDNFQDAYQFNTDEYLLKPVMVEVPKE